LYANSETYNIDTNYITVGGGSTGVFLSIYLGVTEPEDYTNELSIAEDPTLSSTPLK
jgi:para-nitrobenzyl esterase